MRTEELNDLNSALDPEAIDELFANLGTPNKASPPQQVRTNANPAPVVPRRRPSSERQTTRHTSPQHSEGIDWVGWFYKLVMVACFALLAILLLTSYSWSPFRDHPAAQPIRKMVTERRVVTRDIAKFDVGMRAMGKNPLLEQVENAPEPDPETSRKLVLRMTKESGRLLLVKLLRSLDWIEAAGAIEGGTFFLDLPEMGAVGDAYVESILPCPPIEKGQGNVVTGVFAHEADPDTVILSVTFANGAHIKGVTDNHPFFSVDENDFVEIGQMHEGDYVKVNDGVTRITKINSRFARPGEMLYNLETHNQHVYQVTTAGILVHNTCTWDVWNVGQHAVQPKANWSKIFGTKKPTLADIKPYLDDVLKNGSWTKIGDAHGKGGKVVGEILQAEHNGVWVRALKDLSGKIIVNNGGVL